MPVYSHSRLGTYQNCPLAFKFRYIDKLDTEVEETVEAFLGSRVHTVLEKLYTDTRFKKENSIDDLLAFYSSEWEKHWNAGVKIVREGYNEGHYKKMGEEFLRKYYERHRPFDEGTIIGLEKKISLLLDEAKKYSLTGFVDRISISKQGTYEIHDYKTSSHLPLQKYLDTDRQLALYEIALRNMFADVEKVELVWHYLAFDKELRSSRSPEQLEQLRKDIIELIDEIERKKIVNDFPAKESPLCGWCQFQEHCPKKSHARKVSLLDSKEYKKDPGVKLVNKLVELENKKQKVLEELDPEIEEVKQAIYEFAEREGIDNVQGSAHEARIFAYDKMSWPQKGSEAREGMIALLNEHKKFLEFADVDVYALTKAFNTGRLPKELAEKLGKLAEKRRTKMLRLRETDREQ
ncbi:MAG: PD-(D/E)XK nuclease family protein [Candidatus Diapherotrites archaeon]|nr:PD-(D/E)XK nuclease family protein [Candidatus Micrarchaeota archaeon]